MEHSKLANEMRKMAGFYRAFAEAAEAAEQLAVAEMQLSQREKAIVSREKMLYEAEEANKAKMDELRDIASREIAELVEKRNALKSQVSSYVKSEEAHRMKVEQNTKELDAWYSERSTVYNNELDVLEKRKTSLAQMIDEFEAKVREIASLSKGSL